MKFKRGHKINNGRLPWNKDKTGYSISDKRITKKCLVCRKEFKIYPYREDTALYCSKNCKGIAKRGLIPWNKGKQHKIKGICLECGKEFEYHPSKKQKLCNIICSNKYRKGKKRPLISKFMKKRMNSMTEVEKIEHSLKISRAKKGVPNFKQRGKNNSLWKGGKMKDYPESEQIRKSLEYKLWRKAVFERDNFTCQKTGISGGVLNAHHINNFADFPELRLAIDNGITLLEKAHIDFHKIYGKNNNTKEQLDEFLNN